MPELPEVETIVRSLKPLVIGRQITGIDFPRSGTSDSSQSGLRQLLANPAGEFRRKLCGARIEAVERYGKYIVFRLDRDTADANGNSRQLFLLVHLGMTGRLTCEDTPEIRAAHTHMILSMDGFPSGAESLQSLDCGSRGPDSAPAQTEPDTEAAQSWRFMRSSTALPGGRLRWLHYSDIRRFGSLLLTRQIPEELSALGPDPLEISSDQFYLLLRSRRTMLKSLLLDQHCLRGIGNIYADESLFRGRIHPAAIASRLSRKRALQLHQGIRDTLLQAIEQGGSSVSDYVDGQGRTGNFQRLHQVYRRTGRPCFRCGSRIRKIVISSRSTHFCPRCQRK